MAELIDEHIDGLLKATSRSFHLTLTSLPNSVRDQVGLLYLLARLADTIADSKTEDVEALIEPILQRRFEKIPDFGPGHPLFDPAPVLDPALHNPSPPQGFGLQTDPDFKKDPAKPYRMFIGQGGPGGI